MGNENHMDPFAKAQRTVEHHIDPFGNSDLIITCDERDPDAGGASHHYTIKIAAGPQRAESVVAEIHFQHGPRGLDGKLTGVTNAAFLAILIDRVEGLSRGPFPHESNDRVLDNLRNALDAFRSRDTERAARKVLGVNKA